MIGNPSKLFLVALENGMIIFLIQILCYIGTANTGLKWVKQIHKPKQIFPLLLKYLNDVRIVAAPPIVSLFGL